MCANAYQDERITNVRKILTKMPETHTHTARAHSHTRTLMQCVCFFNGIQHFARKLKIKGGLA